MTCPRQGHWRMTTSSASLVHISPSASGEGYSGSSGHGKSRIAPECDCGTFGGEGDTTHRQRRGGEVRVLTSRQRRIRCTVTVVFALQLWAAVGCNAEAIPPAETVAPTETTTPAETISPADPTTISRIDELPSDALKIVPDHDAHPPILHSEEFAAPVPLPGGVNTAGAEDSAFVTSDGATMYFFFTPDVRVPPEKQLIDGVTGIYASQRTGDTWGEATRVVLQDPGKLSLDGAVSVRGDEMWFASAREGNYRGVDMWTARWSGGAWRDWQNAGALLNSEYQIGEMHLSSDGRTMYFHGDRPGGKGGYDIWTTSRSNGGWTVPENVDAINSPETEGWPFVTADGQELWFTRFYMGTPGVFRARLGASGWQEPELIVSQFAGEPTLDADGNLYFVHHYFRDGVMLEADIYLAQRKSP